MPESGSQPQEYELTRLHGSATRNFRVRSPSHHPEYLPYATTAMLGRYIPEANPNSPRAESLLAKLSKRSTMLRIQTGLTALVAVINTVAWIWAAATHDMDARGVGTLFTGSCRDAANLNKVAHLILNGLSTLFLGAGNYCMQILAAPSRGDLNKAHAVGDWLEIGVPSLRNIRKLHRQKVILWFALGIVSILLHLV
ncbi:hypothetical protein MAA_06541 [Metarhizium robertsii ARSEF 23]|nr:uncharacterized protein MAA_06541 [Metarhizium robertsii ARSEF 23]EFY97758.1 hypothetical protein MAA_06541 [Metarhizium robertsii ARSEF 23]